MYPISPGRSIVRIRISDSLGFFIHFSFFQYGSYLFHMTQEVTCFTPGQVLKHGRYVVDGGLVELAEFMLSLLRQLQECGSSVRLAFHFDEEPASLQF